NNFETIILPSFDTSEMLLKPYLSSKTKATLQTLSHYKFKNKLREQCVKKGNRLHIVNESYTTKTCGSCGVLNSPGCATVYNCDCGYTMSRDVHGARNIWLKTYSLFG